jgi:hypothetical protein
VTTSTGTACGQCGARLVESALWCTLCYQPTVPPEPRAALVAEPAGDRGRRPWVVVAAAAALLVAVLGAVVVTGRGGSEPPLGVDAGTAEPIPAQLPPGSLDLPT